MADKINKKLLLTIIILLSFALILVGGKITGLFTEINQPESMATEHHSPPSVIIEPGSAVETASYIIFKDDEGFVYAKNGDTGEIEFSGTDADEVINWALSSLTPGRTWQETVLLKGNFIIDNPLTVSGFTVLKGEPSKITLEDGANCNIIENANPSSYDGNAIIEDLILDGNRVGNTAGHGIYWKHSTQPSNYISGQVTFRRLTITSCDEDGIHVDFYGSSKSYLWLNDINQGFTDGYGFYGYKIYDAHISSSHFAGDTRGVKVSRSGVILMDNLYVNNGIIWDNVYSSKLTNFFIDIGTDVHGFEIKGGMGNQIGDGEVHMFGDGGYTTKSGIKLSTSIYHCTENVFSNIHIGRTPLATTSNQFKYGIYEDDSNQDHNIYSTINTMDVNTAGIILNGANSHVSSSWNGTSWID